MKFLNPFGAESGFDISGNPVLFSPRDLRDFFCVRETDSLGRSFLPGRRREAASWKFDSNSQIVRHYQRVESPSEAGMPSRGLSFARPLFNRETHLAGGGSALSNFGSMPTNPQSEATITLCDA
jgi:hypothetical protein